MQQGHLRDHPGGEGRDGTRTLQRSASNIKYKDVQYIKVFVSVVDPNILHLDPDPEILP